MSLHVKPGFFASIGQKIESFLATTDLISAARKGDISSMRVALSKGQVDFDQTDKEGYSLLHHAVLNHRLEMVRFLLDQGANPNIQGPEGFTPLHVALNEGYFDVAEALIKGGADRDTPNHDGLTAAYCMRANPKHRNNPQALKSFPFSEYDRRYHATKIMSHVFSCRGKVDFNLGGSFSIFMRLFLEEALESYEGEGISESIKTAFKESYDLKLTNKERAAKIRKGELVFIPAGWKGHSIDLVFFNGYVAISNRGQNLKGKSALEVFKINPNSMTEDNLETILEFKQKPFKEAASFFYSYMPKMLNNGNVVQDELARAFKEIAPKPQKGENCGFASPEGALRFAMAMMRIHKETPKPEKSVKSIFSFAPEPVKLPIERQKELLQEAKSLHKTFNKHVTIYAFETYGRDVVDDFYDDDERNLRVMNKLTKADYSMEVNA